MVMFDDLSMNIDENWYGLKPIAAYDIIETLTNWNSNHVCVIQQQLYRKKIYDHRYRMPCSLHTKDSMKRAHK